MSTLFIICGPSGTGKTSLVSALIPQLENIEPSVSHTTRLARPGETDDKNYHFVTLEVFQKMTKENDFLEHAKVFDNYYGTSKSFVLEKLSKNVDIILEIDWQGAQQIKKIFKNTVSIFILPPSLTSLSHRLYQRKQDDEKVIKKRLSEAQNEIQHYNEFDYLLVNDSFVQAISDLKAIITAHRLSLPLQKEKQTNLIRNLLANL